MEINIIAEAAGLVAAGYTTGFLPFINAKLKKSRLIDGLAVSSSQQQFHAPQDWFFDGFRDEDGQLFDPRTDKLPDNFSSTFEVTGHVQAVNSTIIHGEMDAHFVLNDRPFHGEIAASWTITKQGGVCSHCNAPGYKRTFHSCNTPQDVREILIRARKTQSKVRITGEIRTLTFNDKKLQAIHFAGFDQYNSCPVVDIRSVEILH